MAKQPASPLESAVVEVVRRELAAARAEATPVFDWLPASAVFPTAKSPSRALARLARREGWKVTRIAGELYARRADVDALAARELHMLAPPPVRPTEDDVAADVERAFGGGTQ